MPSFYLPLISVILKLQHVLSRIRFVVSVVVVSVADDFLLPSVLLRWKERIVFLFSQLRAIKIVSTLLQFI